MLSNWWLTALTWLEISAQCAVIVLLVRRRFVAQWPSIFAACAINLIAYPALLSMTGPGHNYRTYYWAYWSLVLVQAGIRLWMIFDIIRSIPAISVIPVRVGLIFATFGFLLAAGCAYLTFQPGISSKSLSVAALTFDRCVNFAFVALMIVTVATVALLRFGWDHRGLQVAQVAGGYLASKVVVSLMLSFGAHSVRLFANGFESVAYVTALSLWAVCFARKLPPITNLAAVNRHSCEIPAALLEQIRFQRKTSTP